MPPKIIGLFLSLFFFSIITFSIVDIISAQSGATLNSIGPFSLNNRTWTFNEKQENVDLSFSGDTSANDFFYDASTARIGLGTPSPGSMLELRAAAAAAGTITLSTKELTVVDGDKLGQIDFQAPLESDGTDAIVVGASIWAEADDTFAADNNSTELVFSVANSGAVFEALRIDHDGNVGIGTTSPDTLGHFMASDASVSSHSYSALSVEKNDNVAISILCPNNKNAYLIFGDNNDSLEGGILYDHTETDANDEMVFTVGDTQVAYFTGAGELGIGDDDPDAILEVSASGGATAPFMVSSDDNTDGDWFKIDSSGNAIFGQNVTIHGALTEKYVVTTDTTDGAGTHTAAEMLGKMIIRSGMTAGAKEDDTDTAANIVAAIPNCQVGDGFTFYIHNTDDDQDLTLDGGTGVTISPNDPSNAIGEGETGTFMAVVTNVTESSEAVTIYCLGISAH